MFWLSLTLYDLSWAFTLHLNSNQVLRQNKRRVERETEPEAKVRVTMRWKNVLLYVLRPQCLMKRCIFNKCSLECSESILFVGMLLLSHASNLILNK